MKTKEQTIKEFYNMSKEERARVIRNHHIKYKRTIRQTAKDFNISVGSAFNCINDQ